MKLALLMSVADFSQCYVSFVEGGTVGHIHLNLQASHGQSEIPVYPVTSIHGMVHLAFTCPVKCAWLVLAQWYCLAVVFLIAF